MEKRVKIACIVILIGAILIITGMVTGGNMNTILYSCYNYNSKELPMHYAYAESVPSQHNRNTQLTANGSDIKHLKIDISDYHAGLTIEPHDNRSITYSIQHNTKHVAPVIQIEGDSLVITAKKTKKNRYWSLNWLLGLFRYDMGHPAATITLQIPRNTIFDTANINVGVASLRLDSFTVQHSFTLHTGIGSVDVSNITASNVNIETGIGGAVFRNCSFTDTIMHTGIGETSFDGKIFKSLDIQAGIGEIDMNIHGSEDDYALDIESGIGSVSVNGARSGFLGNRSRQTNKNAAHAIHVESGIGEVAIRFTE